MPQQVSRGAAGLKCPYLQCCPKAQTSRAQYLRPLVQTGLHTQDSTAAPPAAQGVQGTCPGETASWAQQGWSAWYRVQDPLVCPQRFPSIKCG